METVEGVGVRLGFVFLLCAILMGQGGCSRMNRWVESTKPYHTEGYEQAVHAWTREARIYRGMEVKLIVNATLKAAPFREAFAREYGAAYQIPTERARQLLEEENGGAGLAHEVFMAVFVPENKWDEFDKVDSMWKMYLFDNSNRRVMPTEVRRLKGQRAVASHFFPYVTPWKSVYTVRFPIFFPGTQDPVIGSDTKHVTLVITSVLGTAEMSWDLGQS